MKRQAEQNENASDAKKSRRLTKQALDSDEDSDGSDGHDNHEENNDSSQSVDYDEDGSEDGHLEATQREKIRIEKRRGNTKDAECGIIQQVRLINFMCHRSLTVNLGPKVNFIIGHNGSGKSAILTAITVCLGGKATSTNRATNMKGLIRTDADFAQVEVKIKNEGNDAFKHKLYGDSITISRTINKNNSSQYKIKSHDDKVVSRARNELQAICDHMAIQPDNPLLLLSQDAARQFLCSSKPEEFYQLFLKGTQLQQMLDDYAEAQSSVSKITQIMKDKSSIIKELERQSVASENRWKQMEASRNLEEHIQKLKHQIAWSQVYDALADFKDGETKVEHAKVKVETVNEKYELEAQKLVEQEANIAELNSKIQNHNERCAPHRNSIDELTNQIGELNEESNAAKIELRRINDEITSFKRDIEKIDQRLESEKEKQSKSKLIEMRQRKTEEIAQLERKKIEFETLLETKRHQLQTTDYNGQIDNIGAEVNSLKRLWERTDYDVKKISNDIRQMSNAENNRFYAYGENVGHMLREITQMSRNGAFKGGNPIGPLGSCVTLKDQKWGSALDSAIGSFVPYSFIVKHPLDVRLLQKVFEKYQYGSKDRSGRVHSYYEIIVAYHDRNFDYRSGLPARDSRYVPVIDVLKISEPLVTQVLVDNFNAESVILVESRQIGEEVMTGRWPHNVSACFDIQGYRIGHRGRGHSVFQMGKSNNSSGFGTLCLEDSKKQIEALKRTLQDKQASLEDIARQRNTAVDQQSALSREKSELERAIQQLSHKNREIERNIFEIKDKLEAMEQTASSGIIDELVNEKVELQKKIDILKDQFPAILEKRTRLSNDINQKKAEIDEIQKQLNDMDTDIENIVLEMENAVNSKNQTVSNKNHYGNRKLKYEAEYNKSKLEAEEFKSEYEQSRALAIDYCDGLCIEKEDFEYPTTDHIKKALTNATAALNQRNQELGSLEDVMNDYKDKKEKFEKTKKDILDCKRLCKSLNDSLEIRSMRWLDFRRLITQRAAAVFALQLDRRGFKGSLKFDHENEKLYIVVKTGEAQALALTQEPNNEKTRSSRQGKDTRSLSGGEKSFSTVCFLLALWESMYCPIRGLDEFDVFMDQVNRTMAMSMMLDSARSNQQTQYILITPQSIDKKLKDTTDVRIYCMPDPRKLWSNGQQTIEEAFGNSSR